MSKGHLEFVEISLVRDFQVGKKEGEVTILDRLCAHDWKGQLWGSDQIRCGHSPVHSLNKYLVSAC